MPVWKKQGIVLSSNTHDLNGGIPISGSQAPNIMYEGNPVQLSANPDGNVWKMWYMGGNDLVYAESNDGTNWTRWTGAANGVVIGSSLGGWPRMFKYKGVYYFYVTPNPQTQPYHTIDCYTSVDGVHLTLAKSGVLVGGAPGSFDNTLTQLHPVYVDPNTGTWYATYAAAANSNGIYSLSQATSQDGLNWTKFGSVVANNIANVWVQNVNGTYYAWGHTTSTGSSATPTDIFRIQFVDATLTSIVAASRNSVFPETESYEGFYRNVGGEVADPTLIQVNNQLNLFYTVTTQGNLGLGYSIARAIADVTFSTLVASNEGIVLSKLLFMQQANGSVSSGILDVTLPNNTTGNSILFVAAITTGVFSSLTDSLGNLWNQIGSFVGGATPWGLFYARNVVTPTDALCTIHYRATGASFSDMVVLEYYGNDDFPIDVSSLAVAASGVSWSTPSIITNFIQETILSFIRPNAAQSSVSSSAGWNQRLAAIPANNFEGEADINEASISTFSNTFTGNVAGTSQVGIVGVKTPSIAGTFFISGFAGIAGATVSWSGTASGSVVADNLGDYTIPNLPNGTYTITPSLIGYRFNPINVTLTISAANATGINFSVVPPIDTLRTHSIDAYSMVFRTISRTVLVAKTLSLSAFVNKSIKKTLGVG